MSESQRSEDNFDRISLSMYSADMSSAAAEDTEQADATESEIPPPATVVPQMAQNPAPSARPDLLSALLTKADIAKDLVAQCSSSSSLGDDEAKSVIKKLEGVIRSLADDLSNMPLSNFESQRHAEIAMESLPAQTMNQFGRSGEINSVSVTSDREMPPMATFLRGAYDGARTGEIDSPNVLPQLAETLQPAYRGFFCPLTKQIMDDPVTIESGVTFERGAIVEWLEQCSKDDAKGLICPATNMSIKSRGFGSNVALKNTVREWRERNEATRVRIASSALALADSEAMVLDAIKELNGLCRSRRYNKEHMHSVGVTNMVTRFLQHESPDVRCQAMELLSLLAEDEEGKVIIARTRALTRTVKMMSSYSSSERHAAVSFLRELSKSELFLDKIGRTPGGILMLISMKYNKDADPFAAENAEETLKNLEEWPRNIKCMAENGFLEPLLNHLVDGTEEVQTEMVTFLGEIVLQDDMKTYVAERASDSLIKMVSNGNTVIRKEAFKALVQISSHPPNGKILIDAGIAPMVIEEMFSRRIHNEPLDSKEEATAILANILEADVDLDKVQVSKQGHSITSHYSMYNIVHLLKCSMPQELNVNLVKILLYLTKLPQHLATVVNVIKETELIQTIVEFLNSPLEHLATAAAKLLIAISPQMGHTIAATLCKTQGLPEGLLKRYDADRVDEKQAVSANLVAKLPYQNTQLNLALLHQGTVPVVLARIQAVQRGELSATSSRHAGCYLEGLVGVLVRLTVSLFDQEVLQMALSRNLTAVFADLLVRTAGSSEVQRLAAFGLENLSSHSPKLSRRPPAEMKTKPSARMTNYFFVKSSSGTKREGKMETAATICPAHRGVCSAATSFCLLESRAVERLLGCLESESGAVVEAALAAIGTLLDEGVEAEGSVRALSELGGVSAVLAVVKGRREEEGVLQKALWLVERFVEKGGEKFAREVYCDRVLPTVLVSAFHRGDGNTRKLAENILRHLSRILNYSTSSSSFVM